MSLFHSIAMPSFNRSVAIAALMGAAMIASPLTAARAGTVANAAFQMAQASTPAQGTGAAAVAGLKADTIEQRIASLHASLKITTDEEPKWAAVAQAMRDNAAAIDDLKMYQKFAQAHVDGLKNLISSFGTLYSAMPDAQKKVADTVFQASGRQAAASHG